jgi:hypothetical protein
MATGRLAGDQGRRQKMTNEQIVHAVAETIERSMFVPHELPLSLELHAKCLATARRVVETLKFTKPKLVSVDSLTLAVSALRDIAGGMGRCSPPNEMLELGNKGGFHASFAPLLQKVARETIAEIAGSAKTQGKN